MFGDSCAKLPGACLAANQGSISRLAHTVPMPTSSVMARMWPGACPCPRKSVPEARRKRPSDCSKTSRPGRGPKRSQRVASWVLWHATVRRIFSIISVGRGSIMQTTDHRLSELRATNYPPSVTSPEASQRSSCNGRCPSVAEPSWLARGCVHAVGNCGGVVVLDAQTFPLTDTGHALLMHFGAAKSGSGCHHFDDACRHHFRRLANCHLLPRS